MKDPPGKPRQKTHFPKHSSLSSANHEYNPMAISPQAFSMHDVLDIEVDHHPVVTTEITKKEKVL